MDRRQFVHTVAGVTAVGFAGCTGSGDPPEDSNTSASTDPEDNTTDTGEESTGTDGSQSDVVYAEDVDTIPFRRDNVDFDQDAETYDGLEYHVRHQANWDYEIHDFRGYDTVRIRVGVEYEDGEPPVFHPVLAAIDTGTTVEWEWTGTGEYHVGHISQPRFTSEQYEEEGVHFDYQFDEDEDGIHQYSSTLPHPDEIMRAALLVDRINE